MGQSGGQVAVHHQLAVSHVIFISAREPIALHAVETKTGL